MNEIKAAKILAAARKREEKIRATFFISKNAKKALADWARDNGVSESRTIDQLIKATVPSRYFKTANAMERRATKQRLSSREKAGKRARP